MWSTVRSAIDVGLQGQATRLVNLAEDYKNRTIEEARHQAVSAGVTAALLMFGLFFVAVAILVGLIALYYAIAPVHGPFAGFLASGGAALFIACVMFTAVALRGNKTRRPAPAPRLRADIKGAKDDALMLGKQSVEAAAGIIRDGSREAVLATLAATVVIGLLIGRRR